ncbi:MAG: molybdopterin-guanine dinucleotide biosynthesis protein B [Eubacteriales bacterium]
MNKVNTICFVAARSGTGKTTFLEKLIKEIAGRGYRVGVIKGDSHGFEMDVPGKDTWKFAQAGATATAIIGLDKYALIQSTDFKRELDHVVDIIENVDIILVEGFKESNKPKIEVVRREKGTNIISSMKELEAVITDVDELKVSVPKFGFEDVGGIADLIINKYILNK